MAEPHLYMQSHLSSHHPDKYAGESSKESQSQRNLDSFVHAKKCPAERAEEITRRIAEMVARDLRPISIVEGAGFPIIRYSIVKEATIRIAKITIRFSTTSHFTVNKPFQNWIIITI